MPKRRARPVDIANIEAECYAAWLPPEPAPPAPAPQQTDAELLSEVGEGSKELAAAYRRLSKGVSND